MRLGLSGLWNTSRVAAGGEEGRGPSWRETYTRPEDRAFLPVRPDRFPYAPCSIRGTMTGMPQRWTMGHLAIAPTELTWWRHLSRRNSPLRLLTEELRFDQARSVVSGERRWLSGYDTILMCSGPKGAAEFALRYQSDVDDLRGTLGP